MNTNLIFSNHPRHRVQRHIAFWVVWFFFHVANAGGSTTLSNMKEVILHDFSVAFVFMFPHIPYSYFFVYFLVPRFIKRKRFGVSIIFLFFSFIVVYYLWYLLFFYVNSQFEPLSSLTAKLYAIEVLPGVFIPIAIIGSIKFLKFWYVKQQENVMLVRENAIAELQLLKAQVHPHFLFNTLNNIYSFILSKSSSAGDLIEKLSAILQYMISEGEKALVPLEKEIQMLLDYISLEKVRYGERLDITTNVNGELENKFIAPLLMIPFVENAFKHGSSKLLKDPKVRLSIRIEDDNLFFELINNKPLDHDRLGKPNGKGGIGLKNAKKRLELLYPGQHQLKIESTESIFSVKMSIKIVEGNKDNVSTVNTSTHKKILFAKATA